MKLFNRTSKVENEELSAFITDHYDGLAKAADDTYLPDVVSVSAGIFTAATGCATTVVYSQKAAIGVLAATGNLIAAYATYYIVGTVGLMVTAGSTIGAAQVSRSITHEYLVKSIGKKHYRNLNNGEVSDQ